MASGTPAARLIPNDELDPLPGLWDHWGTFVFPIPTVGERFAPFLQSAEEFDRAVINSWMLPSDLAGDAGLPPAD